MQNESDIKTVIEGLDILSRMKIKCHWNVAAK